MAFQAPTFETTTLRENQDEKGSDEQAIVDGDFVVFENELQAVLKALRRGGIDIVAIHHHITEESPRVVFLHYWGVGTTTDLAKALKSALATTRSNSP